MTQEKFNEMMDNYLIELAKRDAGTWSKEARDWCEKNGIFAGDGAGNMMYKKFLTSSPVVRGTPNELIVSKICCSSSS